MRLVERRVVVADVVLQRDRRLVRERRDEVAPADLGRVDLHLARRGLDQPLDDVGRLGAAGAAIGVHRRGVGEHRGHFAVDDRRRVLAGEQRRVQDGRDARGERGEIGAHVRRRVHAHGEELAVLVQRELGLGDVVAAVRVGHERLGALGGPLHRPVHLLRRPGDDDVLGVEVDLRAEAAADVGRDDAHLVLGQAEHEGGHQQPLDVRVLARDVERVAVVGAAVARVRRARLDRVRDQPVVDELERRDVRRAGERLVDRGLVAERPDVAGVVRRDVVQLRGPRLARVDGVDDRRQHFVVDLDQLGGVLRLPQRLGDHDRDVVADVRTLPCASDRMRRLLHRLAVDVGDQPAAGQAADFALARSSPVKIATTPGDFSALSLRIDLILACACGERTK